MIQDIRPHVYDNAYQHRRAPRPQDYVFIVRDGREMLMRREDDSFTLPTVAQIGEEGLTYAFSVDEHSFFVGAQAPKDDSFAYVSQSEFRTLKPQWLAFAGITGMQLWRWMRDHKFCSRCGAPVRPSDIERAYCCDSCGDIVYPKISPACIVGVTHGDYILVTKYAGRIYRGLALVAGFNEIGETIEETVHREVMEEVGLRIKNLQFYKSQPWSFTDSLLFGFYAELDGEDESITLDTTELGEAKWLHRSELPSRAGEPSLTAEMMEMFRIGKQPERTIHEK